MFFKNYVQRSRRNLFISSCVLVLIVIIVICLNYHYVLNVVRGPKEFIENSITDISDLNFQMMDYVTISGNITRVNSQIIAEKPIESSNYGIITIGKRSLIIKGYNTNSLGNIYTGTIVNLDQFVNNFLANRVDMQQASLPFMLDSSTDFYTLTKVEIVVEGLVLIWCLFALITIYMEKYNGAMDPILVQLRFFGKPEDVAREIDAEALIALQTIGDRIHLTENWLIYESSIAGDNLKATRLDDIIYICKRRHMQQYTSPFSLMIFGRRRPMMTANAIEREIDDLIDAIYNRVPWIIVERDNSRETGILPGLSNGEAYISYWLVNQETMLAEVEERRKQWEVANLRT